MKSSKRNKQPTEDTSSSPRREASRWKLPWHRRKSEKSSKAAQANDRPSTVDGVVARPSSHTTDVNNVVDRAGPSSIPKTEATSAEAVNRTESWGSDETAVEAGEVEATDQTSLWDLAYDALRKEKPDVVNAYEALLSETGPYLADASSATDLENLLSKAPAPANPQSVPTTASIMTPRKKMENVIALGQKHMEEKKIAVKVGGQEFVLQDQIQHVVAGIYLGKDWIDNAVTASPLASAAWAAVCLFLPLLTNPSDVEVANTEGFAYVTQKIEYYAAMESTLFGNDDSTFPPAFREHVVELYKAIIDF